MPELGAMLFRFHVLVYLDRVYNFHVGQCLETGSVVTADDAEVATDMMREVLEDEVNYAIEHKSFTNLYSSPAPPEVWAKWFEAAKEKQVRQIPLRITATELRLNQREVPGEVEMAQAQ